MKKKLWKSVISMMGIMGCLLLIGCSKSGAGKEIAQFEGSHLKMQYDKAKWNIEGTDISDYPLCVSNTQNDTDIVIAYFDDQEPRPDELLESVKYIDLLMGDLEEVSSENTLGEEGGKAKFSYYVKSNNDEYEDYRCMAEIKDLGEGKYVASIAWLNGKDNKEEQAVQSIMDSLEYSEVAEIPKLAVCSSKPMYYGSLTYHLGMATGEFALNEDLDTSMRETGDYEYVGETTIQDFEGNEYVVKVPLDESGNDGTYYGYNDNGINFFLSMSDTSFTSLEEILKEYAEDNKEDFKKDADRYENVEEQKIEIKDGKGFGWITADEKDSTGAVKKAVSIYYAEAVGEQGLVNWEMSLSNYGLNNATPIIMRELGDAYGIDIDSLIPSGSYVTLSGQPVDTTAEEYVYTGNGQELMPVNGFDLLGQAEVKMEYEENSPTGVLFVPRGNDSHASEHYLKGVMHGIEIKASYIRKYNKSLKENVEYNLDLNGQYYLDSSSGYKNFTNSDVMEREDKKAAMGAMSGEAVGYDGESYPFHLVIVVMKDKGDYLVQLEITLNEGDYDYKTNEVLQQLEKAYDIDLSAYYNKQEY